MSAELFPLLDRNKTAVTHDVTQAVVRYLDEQGFKPVETEVPVCDGWVADVAACIVPTRTEAINLKLVPRKPKYDCWRFRDEEYIAAYRSREAGWDSLYDALPNPVTALVEVKTSRADFAKDRKWSLEPPTNLRYLAAPSGMLRRDEYPAGWSVLTVNDAGDVRMVQRGEMSAVPLERQIQTVLAVAVRRDHQTRYARLREFQKAERRAQAESTSVWRFTYCVRAIQKVLKAEGQSVEDVLLMHGIKGLGVGVVGELRELWGKAK